MILPNGMFVSLHDLGYLVIKQGKSFQLYFDSSEFFNNISIWDYWDYWEDIFSTGE